MSFDLGVFSCQQRPLQQPDGGLPIRDACWPDPFRAGCIISTAHVCLCGVWGRLQITGQHDIQLMTYYSSSPPLFPSPKSRIARYFTSLCCGCSFPSHSSQLAAIIGKICSESKLWLLLVLCIIAHSWRMLLSWRQHDKAPQGSRAGITCTLVMIYQSCWRPHFFTSS